MNHNQCISLCLMALVLGQAATLPQHTQYPQQFQQQVRDERKFAEKPNAMKKVALDDLDDISTNQIQVNYRYTLQYFVQLFPPSSFSSKSSSLNKLINCWRILFRLIRKVAAPGSRGRTCWACWCRWSWVKRAEWRARARTRSTTGHRQAPGQICCLWGWECSQLF